jgi:integrase/recombinase XerC
LLNEAFVAARDDAGLDEHLDPHCLRYSFVTHLTEFGYPARFVQEQVGHASASTTEIYMNHRELHQPGDDLQVAC